MTLFFSFVIFTFCKNFLFKKKVETSLKLFRKHVVPEASGSCSLTEFFPYHCTVAILQKQAFLSIKFALS